MHTTKTLKLLLTNDSFLDVEFYENPKHMAEGNRLFNEVFDAKKENTSLSFADLSVKEMRLQGRKIAPIQFIDSRKIVGWSLN